MMLMVFGTWNIYSNNKQGRVKRQNVFRARAEQLPDDWRNIILVSFAFLVFPRTISKKVMCLQAQIAKHKLYIPDVGFTATSKPGAVDRGIQSRHQEKLHLVQLALLRQLSSCGMIMKGGPHVASIMVMRSPLTILQFHF
jgi:hypothetical protein